MYKLIILLTIFYLPLYGKCNIKTDIPENAKIYLPVMYYTIDKTLTITKPYYFGSLIEQESCVTICGTGYYARRCWSPSSELKTKREQGIGFGQLTRAWTKDGRLRFDTIANLRKRYPKELSELSWDTVKYRPDLQMKAILLLWKSNYNKLNKNIPIKSRIAFADSIYNGGFKYFNYERKKCKLTKGCDPNLWFNNVSDMKSKRALHKLYGNRSAWDINRDHVEKVLKTRINKYREGYYKQYEGIIYNEYDDSRITVFYGE